MVENAIAKALPVGFRLYTLNEALTLMGNLPYQNRREVENTIKVDGLESYEQFNKMLVDSYPQSVTTKYYCPLTIQVYGTKSWGEVDEDGYEEDSAFAARHEDVIRQCFAEYNSIDENNMAEYFDGTMACPKSYVLLNGASSVETASSTDASPFRPQVHLQRKKNRISRSGSPDRTRTDLAKDSSREKSTSRVDIEVLSCM